MSMFNKHGVEFTNLVCVDRDPTISPTYTHPFPALRGNRIIELWSTKVRPIKTLTAALRGVRLMRDVDYMIDYNAGTQKYEYWFLEGANATLFALMCGSMTQTVSAPGHKFDIVCPHCSGVFAKENITWI